MQRFDLTQFPRLSIFRLTSTVILIMTLFSCVKEENVVNTCTKCSSTTLEEEMSFKVGGVSVSGNLRHGTTLNREGSAVPLAHGRISNEEFDKITEYLKSESLSIGTDLAYIFYVHNHSAYRVNKEYGESDIRGLGVYYTFEGKLFHRFFINRGDELTEDLELRAQALRMYSRDFESILYSRICSVDEHDYSVVSIVRAIPLTEVPAYSENQLKRRLVGLEMKDGGEPVPDPNTCGYGCMRDGDPCNMTSSGEYICGEEGCEQEEYSELLIGNPEFAGTNILATAYNSSLLYNFRDNFLDNYPLGQQYISYYYQISAFTPLNFASESLMIQTTYVLFDFIPAIERLLDAQNHGNEVLIDNQLQADLIQLITDYKLLSGDAYYQATLDAIILDINTFSGMTVDQVIANL